MDLNEKEVTTPRFLNRLKKSWMPLAAVAGALASFASAAMRTRPAPAVNPEPDRTQKASGQPDLASLQTEPAARLKSAYSLVATLGGKTSSLPFRDSLVDISLDDEDTIYSLGDDEVRVYGPSGAFIRRWKVQSGSACLEAGPDGNVYIGSLGRVDIYTSRGEHKGGLDIGNSKHPAAVTAIKALEREILVADAGTKIIYRYDVAGKQLGVIGDKNKTGSFMLPNGWLDIDVDQYNTIWATDTGRHRVTGWVLDGSPVGDFGKFGLQNPSDFVGCCNPVNLAVTPEGNIVTAEKVIARVKVYTPEGELIAFIGPENFDQKLTHIHLAVDSAGRILAADPVRREIKIFAPETGQK